MNIKHIIKLSLLSVLLIGLNACTDQLKLEPAQSISEGLALSSHDNVLAVLIGAYDELGNTDLFGGNTLRNAELLGGDGEVFWAGTFNAPGEIFNKNMLSTNLDVQETWLEGYETINIANNVLTALDVVNADAKDRVEGEALFIRAMVYFELVRFYAQQYEDGQASSQLGIPLVLTPTRSITTSDQVSRNSVEEVYTQIIADLTRAESTLPAGNDIFATSGAAAALLARVYLQKGDYAGARDAADRVIGSGNYALLGNYADCFNNDNNTAEDIFATQVTSQDGENQMNLFFSIPAFGGRDGDVDILQGHLDLYDANDARLALFYDGNGAMRSGKWNNQFGNVNLFRLAEMYLVRAECNIRLGTQIGDTPLNDYNAVHTRAGLNAAMDVMLDDILLERRLELAHEGHKVHDVKRLKGMVGSRAYNDNALVFPIPQREVNANPNLQQNPGYE